MRRALPALLSILIALHGHAWGQLQVSGDLIEVNPGEFAAMNVQAPDGTRFEVVAPAFLVLTGPNELVGGRVVLYFYVDRNAPAGDHQVQLVPQVGTTITAKIRVSKRTSIELVAPAGTSVVQGEPVYYEFTVRNTGNAVERVELQVRGRLEPQRQSIYLEIEAGSSADVSIGSRQGLRAGRDVTIITAVPLSDAAATKIAVIRTEVLLFAGAEGLSGLALAYRFEGGATYGTAGWSTRATARLEGDLSDFVTASADATFERTTAGYFNIVGRLRLSGEDWSVGYRGTTRDHRIDVQVRDLGVYTVYAPGLIGVGASYDPSNFFVRASHVSGAGNSQSAAAGYRFRVSPEVVLTPIVAGTRNSVSGGSALSGSVRLVADVSTAPVIAAVQLSLPLPVVDDWMIAAAASTRSRDPVGVRADVTVTPTQVTGSITANERLSDEVSLSQALSYAGSGRLTFAVRYSPLAQPLVLTANAGAELTGGTLGYSYGASASYRPSPFALSLYLGGVAGGIESYGARVGYSDGWFGGALEYSHSPTSDLIGASINVDHSGVAGRARYRYDPNSNSHVGSLDVSYRLPQGHSVFGQLELANTLAWEIGASVVVNGGFATPDSIVDTFGGRRGGEIAGTVFHDLNRNNLPDAEEPTISDAVVSVGGQETTSDESGAYRMFVPAGVYELAVSGIGASLGLTDAIPVVVEVNSQTAVDVPLETVGVAVVTVFDDANRDGARSESELALAGVSVELEGEGERSFLSRTNERGEAVFQRLPPGNYVAQLLTPSLPVGYEPTTGPAALTVEAGPILRTDIGVGAMPRQTLRTLEQGALTLVASLDPPTSPPGADVLIMATVLGGPAVVTAALPGGPETALLETESGIHSGHLALPADAHGVLLVTVTAAGDSTTRNQVLPLVIAPGPLARVEINPALADPGERLRIEAHFLTLVEVVEVIFAGVRHELAPTDDPYTFVADVSAPTEQGSYTVELLGDGVGLIVGRFLVN